ncbi:MAG: hypothetical protein ACREOG_21520 [Gemmatimonadaceae bacterium]
MPATPISGTPSISRSPAPTPRRGVPVDSIAHSLVGEYLTAQQEEREAAARRQRPPRPWRRIASIVSIVACGVVWLVPSLGTRPAPAMSAERQAASARLALFLASQRVRTFEQQHGRLPNTVRQSGVSDPRISMRLTGKNTYRLSLVTPEGQRWDLSSTAADSSYMRDALARLGVVGKAK